MTKKGLLVILCGPSQFGKDYIISQTSQILKKFDLETTQPTVYKIRKSRQNDPAYIKCVEDEKDIPIKPEDRLEYVIYGKQKVVYSKSEIESKLQQGKIMFVTVGDPDFATELKKQFYNNSVSVFVRGFAVGAEQMAKTELTRKELKIADLDTTEGEEILFSMENRLEHIKSLKPQYEKFMQDKVNGADYVYTNYWTLFGGHWNTHFDEIEKSEEYDFIYLIEDIHQQLSKDDNAPWRIKFKRKLDGVVRDRNPYNLDVEWKEYLAQKDERTI